MVVGDPGATSQEHVGLSYQCMNGMSRGAITAAMPDQPCPSGIFTTHHFPT